MTYQAQSWDKPYRVTAKLEWHPGELEPQIGYIVTNITGKPPKEVVRFYNKRGTAEQYIKEGKHTFIWDRLSCQRFKNNDVRLQLHALAYNFANFLRCIERPKKMNKCSLASLQLHLFKIEARVVRHARAIIYHLEELTVTGWMILAILASIRRL